MSKVGFVIGGVQKCGTSAMAKMLNTHPEIYIPEQKEIHFFNHNARFRLDCFSVVRKYLYRKYDNNFVASSSTQLCGETTQNYIFWHNAAGNIWRYNPEMKWIILLRHPVYRAYSAWSMMRNRGQESRSFSEALAVARKIDRQTLPYQNQVYSYIDRGYYAHQLRRLFQIFGEHKVLVVTNLELRKNQTKYLEKIAHFLGINTNFDFKKSEVRIGSYSQPLDRQLLAKYIEKYQFDIQETASLTGKDLSPWLSADYDETNAHV